MSKSNNIIRKLLSGKASLLIAAFLMLTANTSAQATNQAADETVYTDIEVRPEFPGGMQAFYAFVARNYKIPMRFRGEGKIITQFIVEKDGTLSDIKVLRDLGSGTGKAAVKMLKNCPKWSPAIQNGKPVRVMYSLPIQIKID